MALADIVSFFFYNLKITSNIWSKDFIDGPVNSKVLFLLEEILIRN